MAPYSKIACVLLVVLAFAGCAHKIKVVENKAKKSYTVMGKTYYPLANVKPGYFQDGIASWYGPGFQGKKTASGEIYNMHDLTAAHNILPLNSIVRVKNLKNNKEVTVRINDRGPFVGDRVIDLSLASAKALGMVEPGTVPVRLTVVSCGGTMLAKNSSDSLVNKEAKAPNPFYPGITKLFALRQLD